MKARLLAALCLVVGSTAFEARGVYRRAPRAAVAIKASTAERVEPAPPVYWFSGFEKSSRAKEFDRGVDAINRQVDGAVEMLDEICASDFFNLYSVDMLASCAYMMQASDECNLQQCECLPCDDEDVPVHIVKTDQSEFQFALDGWSRWDIPSSTYYDLREYPEAYTRYNGSKIWTFVYDKICFKGRDEWKRDFNRAVSGLHASISGHVVRSMYDEGERDMALREYRKRLREQQGAVENMYYTCMILLNACNDASVRLRAYEYGDTRINEQVGKLLSIPLLCGGCVGAAQQNLRRHASEQGGAGLWQARLRARDLIRLMNCVQCSVCRLHGKVGTLGVSTGMQILLGQEGRGGDAARMHRVEVAALITTLHKVLASVQTVRNMEARLTAAQGLSDGEVLQMGGFDGLLTEDLGH